MREALGSIGLAETEAAASALLNEGLRRCQLLLPDETPTIGGGDGAGASAGDATLSGRFPEPAEHTPGPSDSTNYGNGWDFDEDDYLLSDGGLTVGSTTTAVAAVRAAEAVAGAGAGGWTMAVAGAGNGTTAVVPPNHDTAVASQGQRLSSPRGGSTRVGGGDGSGPGEQTEAGTDDLVYLLRARLEALLRLLETWLEAEGVQGRGFDVARFQEFIFFGESGERLSAAADAGGGGAGRWEDGAYRTGLLRKSLAGFAMAGEALALAVLFEKYPLETLPVRLEALR